ncbi:YHYH protein [Alteromonas sp. 5E99-2]|uniref:YHYH protein n=1 Tax=Alteromonas sp. 5E99-2 TaxID=2817683 RepID=UPI001A988004|nr:YHYH protein [Alteromonas sp. 5E99-2]MBO1254725.1 YHYH protein [Alteromonas sp. 5E99-2]
MTKASISSLIITGSLAFSGCGGSSETITDDETSETPSTDILAVDTTLFDSAAVVSVETIDCTLSNGDDSSCYAITVTGFPSDRTELGHFCPTDINTEAESAGKWFDDGVLYDLTGEFVSNLDLFYGNSEWQLFDADTGEIFITDTQVSCEAAARPDVAEEYQNHCVQCELTYYADEGQGVESTFLLPINPVFRETSGDIGMSNIGVSLNGVNLAAAAPTQAILSAFTIAAFDDCVGHVNPIDGYHYHGANHGDGECPAVEFEADGHAGIFGYALDGFAIYGMLDENGEEATDLDECRGQTDEVRGYHYHSAGPGENAFIGCFSGETANSTDI